MTDELDNMLSAITVALAVQPRTVRNGFGGKGVSRRRDAVVTGMMAESLAKHIIRSYTLMRDGAAADHKQLTEFVKELLMAVPDDVAATFADKATYYAEPARKEIAQRLHDAIHERWSVTYTPTYSTWEGRFGQKL